MYSFGNSNLLYSYFPVARRWDLHSLLLLVRDKLHLILRVLELNGRGLHGGYGSRATGYYNTGQALQRTVVNIPTKLLLNGRYLEPQNSMLNKGERCRKQATGKIVNAQRLFLPAVQARRGWASREWASTRKANRRRASRHLHNPAKTHGRCTCMHNM